MGPTFEKVAGLVTLLNGSAAARNLMEAFPRVIQFSVAREGGPFFVRIEDGSINVHGGTPNDPDLIVDVTDGQRFLQVLNGHLDISHVVAEGKLTVERGRLSEMILLNRILAAGQKGKKT